MNSQVQTFGKIRSIFFPIHTHELKRFIPMALMMLFILFNYTVLRNIKDSLVVNAKGSDADIISFLKLWGTTPAAILFMLFYSKLSNAFKKGKDLLYLFNSFYRLFWLICVFNLSQFRSAASIGRTCSFTKRTVSKDQVVHYNLG